MNLADWPDWMRMAQAAAPLLPQPSFLPLLRQAGWALVLAALVSAALQGFGAHWMRDKAGPLALVCALWAGIPGPWGLSYWLGLAFQTPSLMAMVLSLQYLCNATRNANGHKTCKHPVWRRPNSLAPAGHAATPCSAWCWAGCCCSIPSPILRLLCTHGVFRHWLMRCYFC